MSYILGIIHGDGSVFYNISSHTYFIKLQTISKPFVESFADNLKQIDVHSRIDGPYIRKRKQRIFPNGQACIEAPFFNLVAYSKSVYEWYQQFNPRMNPEWLENLESYLDTSEKQRLWLKGFYESEGSVCYQSKQRQNSWRVYFTNTNISLLELIQKILISNGYRPLREGNIHLRLNQRSKQFLNWLNPCIKHEPRIPRNWNR